MSTYLFIVKIELPHVIQGLMELPDDTWVPECSTDADVPDTVGSKLKSKPKPKQGFWKRQTKENKFWAIYCVSH